MYPLFTYYPRWQRPPEWVTQLAGVFTEHQSSIDSRSGAAVSNEVLRLVCSSLIAMGFLTESSKSNDGQLPRPVFFGENGVPTRQYKIDSYLSELRIALEIEAGRAVAGNAIYRDIVQMALLVDVDYAAVAVPLAYRYSSAGKTQQTEPYRHCISILEAIYGGRRLDLPFQGFLLIGY
jgi:hypothetical protein